MAEITIQIAYLGVANASLTATCDDLTNAIVRFNLTCARNVQIKLWRTGNVPWREFALTPGAYEYPSGGPVQTWSDITYVELASR